MFERTPPTNPTDDPAIPQPPERMMRITPMDMRQHRFKPAMRGYDKTDVVAFLTEAADDYEQAMREISSAWRRCSPSTASASATCAIRCSPRSGCRAS
jgi:DivIVA domain-containing protein